MERVTKNIIARDKKLTGNFKDFNEAMTEIYLLEKGVRDENKVWYPRYWRVWGNRIL